MRVFSNSQSISKPNRHAFITDKQPVQDDEDVDFVRNRKRGFPGTRVEQFEKKHSPQVTGQISTVVNQYLLSGKGTQNSSFATVAFTSLPGAQKRILQNSFASYTLTNYANTDFPPAIYISCAQLQGMMHATGQSSHIIAVMLPLACSVPVYNAGGIVGYNQTYSLKDSGVQYDITNVNDLTFEVSVTQDGSPVHYPLSQQLIYGIKVANASL